MTGEAGSAPSPSNVRPWPIRRSRANRPAGHIAIAVLACGSLDAPAAGQQNKAVRASPAEGRPAELVLPSPSPAERPPLPDATGAAAPAALGTPATAAQAVDGGATNVVSYPPEFFREFQPTNAFDMISRLPGFSFNRGAADIRGFNGAVGNVLVDGERPASKSIPLDDILRRIPVSGVVRIEIIRGGSPGIDMQGQPIVANIVRGTAASSSLAAELWTKIYSDHEPARVLRAEASRRSGALSLEGSLHLRQEKEQTSSGRGRVVRRNGSGAIVAQGPFESDWDRSFVQGGAAASYDFGRSTLRLSVGGQAEWQDRADIFDFGTPAGGSFLERIDNDYRTNQLEGSADLGRELGDGVTARIIVLRTRKSEKQDVLSLSQGPELLSNERNVNNETIGRSTLTIEPATGITVEAGIEASLNRLDARTALRRAGVAVALPSANVAVKERRGEGFANLRWTIVPTISFDGGIRYETSTISQSGDANQKRHLKYLKPRAQIAWDLSPTLQLRVRGERTVGQLNFKDFAATAALDTGSANAGNPDLVPERAWVAEGAVERRFWGKGVAVLTLSRAWVTDVADLIPVQGIDAPGNIGKGTRDEAKLSLTMPGGQLGVKGFTLRFNGTYRRSSVTDPVTFIHRRISRQRPFEGDLLVTKELPALKSTISLEATAFGYRETQYRIREIRTESDSTPFKIYWDWTPQPSLSIRIQAENISFKTRRRERTLFASSRASGAVTLNERRYARLAPFLMTRVRKTF